jgi:hypothetical protein
MCFIQTVRCSKIDVVVFVIYIVIPSHVVALVHLELLVVIPSHVVALLRDLVHLDVLGSNI